MNIERILHDAVAIASQHDEANRTLILQSQLLGAHLQNGRQVDEWMESFRSTCTPQQVELLRSIESSDIRVLLEKLYAQEDGGLPPAESTQEIKQIPYIPRSRGPKIGALSPANLATATQRAMDWIEQEVGDFDEYVRDKAGFDTVEALWQCLSAEQIDAAALWFYNEAQGSGMIIGDDTGLGKTRVLGVAAKHAHRKGRPVLFATKKTDLLPDCFDEWGRIGLTEINPFPTNSNLDVPLRDGRSIKALAGSHDLEMARMCNSGELSPYNLIATTYYQMQTVKGEEPLRRTFMRTFAPDCLMILDESHEAGGEYLSGDKWKKKGESKANRAEFARELVKQARATLFSSATWAKDPNTLTLYQTTSAFDIVEKPELLVSLLSRGGSPLQQVLSVQLAEAGQYIRREKSFEGVDIGVELVEVSDRFADDLARCLRAILEFDDYVELFRKVKESKLRAYAKALKIDTAVGEPAVSSIGFASILHNLIGQFLLAIAAEPTAKICVETLERGEKPIVGLYNTMGSFLGKTVKYFGIEHDEFVKLSFSDLLIRYLERDRVILIQDEMGHTKSHYITDQELQEELHELGKAAIDSFNAAVQVIKSTDFSELPVSPIDWIKYRLRQAGYSVGEITGREHTLDYIASGEGFYRRRPIKERNDAASVKVRDGFNGGMLDVVILNPSGGTGISLHASRDYADQRRRHFVSTQAPPNINDFLQVLGRAHRAGQVCPPRISFVSANLPAAKRPMAVLLKKMASLNANTIAARKSNIRIEGIDFINGFGDRASEAVLEANPRWNALMGRPLDIHAQKGDPGYLIRRVTGRIPMLPIADQEAIYDLLEQEYNDVLEEATAAGSNDLDAYSLDLQAKTLSSSVLIPGTPGSKNPFTGPVYKEVIEARVLDPVISQRDVIKKVRSNLNLPKINLIKKHDFSATADLAKQSALALIEKVRQEALTYQDDVLENVLKPASNIADKDEREKRKAERSRFSEKLNERFGIICTVLRQFAVGTPVRVVMPDSTIRYGVVTRIANKQRSQDPTALSGWRLELTLAGTDGQLPPIPFIRINPKSDEEYGFRLTPSPKTLMGEDVYPWFDNFRQNQRVKRIMLRGNLLRAFELFRHTGLVVNYTTDSGEIRQGILLRSDCNPEEIVSKSAVQIPNASIVLQLLENGISVKTKDQSLTISISASHYVIATSASKDIGAKHYQNQNLLDAANAEFISVGRRMQMVVERDRISQVLQVLKADSGQLVATTNLDKVKELLT